MAKIWAISVWGKLSNRPAARSGDAMITLISIGLAHHVRLTANVFGDPWVCWHHVDVDQTSAAVRLRLAQQDKLSSS